MKTSLQNAMRLSQSNIRTGQSINDVLLAEQQIATSAPDAFALHCAGASAGYVALWKGLRFATTGSHAEACREFLRATELGCSHWRVGWYLAQSARAAGDLPLVDEACAAVLRANPEFWFARELPKHARGYYAQGDQDKHIEDYFRQHPPRSKCFVEVGAFDGVHYSNVRRLVETHGWSGVSIEPVSKNYAKLAASYHGQNVRCVRACVSDREGEVELNVSTYPHLPDWGSDVASVSGEDTERWRKQYGAVWTKEKVPARTLTSILDEALVSEIGFLSVDAEGHDLEVLRGLDFERFQPDLIVVEYGKQRDAILRFLAGHGYTMARDNKQDLFMTRARATGKSRQPSAALPNQREQFTPQEQARILAAAGCRDCDDVPKVAQAGAVLPGDPPVQIMQRTAARRQLSGEELPSALRKLNPHLLRLNTLPIQAGVCRGQLDPLQLVTPERFDIVAKHLYARHRAEGIQCDWARELYQAHISAFSDGTFREGDGQKNSIEDYFRSFDATLDSIRAKGFDAGETLVPVGRNHVIIDGAHRVAACLLHRKPVDCLIFDREANRFDAGFFLAKGLPPAHADALAIEYCRLRQDTFIVHLFPKAEGRDAEARAILREFGAIVYEKELRLRNNGPWWLVRQLYRGEKWIGSWNDSFAGARRDAQTRFDGKSPLRVIVFQCDDLAKVREAKTRIRALYGHGNYSSHVNDTHEETLRLARLYFNTNSLHFLNHAKPRFLERFEKHLDRYRQWLHSTGVDAERFCVDGSAVMAAYGLRDAQDLDVLHFGEADFSAVEPEVNSHNAQVHHHLHARDELLFNPEHHFHYDGLKFVSLAAIRAMKAKRGEGKDLKDVALMDAILNGRKPSNPATSPFVVTFEDEAKSGTASPAPSRSAKTAVRLYYIPNGNDYHIAALLNEMFTEVKPFACRDVQDYIDRRILAYKTTDASSQLWDEVQAMRPDLVYVESGRNIEPATLQRIRTELGIPVTMWFGDACVNDQFIERLMAYAPCVDRQIVVDRGVAEAAARRGLQNVEFIPFFGYDHYFHPLNAPKTLEILFSGKSYDGTFAQYPFAAERLAFVRRVNAEFGRRLAVVGENWDQFGLANYVPERVPEWEVNELNNHAKIVLAFDAAHVREFTSCRTYHALLGRSFVLIRKFPGIENLFVNGEHLVWFESAGEGIALLRHYLDQPAERERIAEAGYQHVHRNGWKFSNVVRYLVDRGLKRETRNFEQVHAPYSEPLPQPARYGRDPMKSATPAPAAAPAPAVTGHPRLSAAAQGCLEQAESFFNQGRLEDARDWLERAIDLEPDQLDLLLALANLSLQLGTAPAAEIALTHALVLRPGDNAIRVSLASAQYKQGKVEAFEETLSHVLRSNPSDPSAIRFLADLNLEHHRFKDAANGYFKLLQQNENDIPSLLSLGVCFFKTGDRAAAAMTFERLLQLQPDHALARENLAACHGVTPTQTIRTAAPEPAPVRPATPLNPKASAPPESCAMWSQISLERYFQPPAGSTERAIQVMPTRVLGSTQSAYQALKQYEIRDFGTGLDAASAILAHILKSKLNTAWTAKNDFWPQTLVLSVRCELRGASGAAFDETQPKTFDDVGLKLAPGEEPRRAEIEQYARQLRAGTDLGRPLYVTGALLGKLAPGAKVDPKAIYMMDGARRITASALAHRRSIDALLLMHEEEYAALLQPETLVTLRARLASLKWFESYQSIPMLGLRGQRTLRRFDLMALPPLRDAVVMDFGCNTGQACLKAAQAGARHVVGIEGMPDTFAGAQEIAQLAGFGNVRYANINFNDADFARQIDAVWAEPVDYAFFFSVYRTKELTQREQLFRYILSKARKGVFFEGHASAKIDTLEYYEWLFESFGVKGKFLGHSEGELRPLFYIDLATSRQSSRRGDEAEDSPSRSVPPPPVGGYGSAERWSVSAPLNPRSPASAPLVSAIVSTYNNERFMEGRLRDLVAQTLGERLEIIVVDSGSEQNEGAMVKRFMEKHPNIRYIRTEERERIYQAWNRGIHAARGKYITNANTDDRLRPDALEILAGELESNPKAALVYADFFITNTENEDFHTHTRTGYSIKPDFAPDIMLDGCHMGPQPMWRRSLHDELGWFDESLVAAGDYDFWCRVAAKHPMLHVQEFLGLYLHNAAGICNSNSSRTGQETEQVRAKYRSQFPAPRANLPRGFYYRDAVKPGRFVNIGMVTFNRLEFTRRAIPALLEHTDFPSVLTVVDNASTDGTREYLTALKQLGVIKNLVLLDENVGVAKASNLAWSQEPSAEFYLKLDNDIVIQKPGWLTKMVEVAERVPQLGVLAYNFEPVSYPQGTVGGCVIRVKQRGNLGGACLLIPKRTERELGCWCEDYGLYGEEDADYAERVRLTGRLIAYMDDEDIGLHLPAGKAAAIDQETHAAADGVEEKQHKQYREWKDQLRRQNAQAGGAYHRNVIAYHQQSRPLKCESAFVKAFHPRAVGNPRTESLPRNPVAGLVSIVIPVFNRLDMTQPCLEAIHRETKAGTFEIVVVDNASSDGTQEYLEAAQAAGRLRTIRNPENFGFARAINQGIRVARGEFILMLNNDTIPLPGWLEAMVNEISSTVSIGAVGACLLYPGGELIQHGGVTIGAGQGLLHPYHKDRLRRLDRVPAARQTRDTQAVTGACLLVRRPVVDRIGLLDEAYVNGFEDVDFCFRIITAGWRIRYSAESRVIHHESMTPGRKKHEEANYRRMNARWKSRITPDESPDDTSRGIQDVLCREKLVQEPGHRRAMELLREIARSRGDKTEAAEWCERLKRGQGAGDRRIANGAQPVQSQTAPIVTIVIPTFNNLALTRQCLAALYQTTPAALAELIIVDNGSTDGSVPFLETEQNAGRLRAVFNPQNLGFACGCNQGALEARGEFVLFLNNDTQTQPGWLEALLNSARETQAGVVGCKLLYPDGSIQHAGIEFINGVPDHRFRHAPANAPEVNQRREFDMVSGACFLMPRKLFLDLGGFDEVFRNGVEDVDLCLRVREAGRKVVYEPQAVVIHHEGKTQGRFNHVSENLKIFFARWKGQFDEQHRLRVPKKPRQQKSGKSLLLTTVGVSWDGSFLDLGSLSHVNRELTAALSAHPQIQLTRLGKNAVPKPLAGMKSIIDCARTLRAQPSKPAQVTIRHAWPPNWERPAHGAWVLIQPWEFGSLPKEWVQNLARVDEVWVPSDFVRRVYADSGVDAAKVHVVPNGIDPHTFRPDAQPMALATKKSFKFLFVGGTILRKGPDLLLKAYLESFTAQDDVCLVIKDFGGQSVYAGQTFEAQVKAAQARPNAPEILYLNEELPPEALPGLYTACDCLVHPYRGEGFGLPVLEAMACALPVVVTAGGSTDDFATDEFAYRVPSIRKIFGSKVSDLELVKPGWMLEPDHTALVERLKWIAAHRDEAKARGRAASEHVRREWTWERAARIAAARLVLLNERPRLATPAPGSRKPKAIALPACGKLGHLGEARELFRAGKLLPAWNATVAALKTRPYHPEAFLLLAEIALAAGDSKQAKELGDRACRLAPKWKPARQFAKAKHPKSAMTKLELPALPRAITDGYSRPRLSVFLITKNEERFIGQCLESVRDIATQIVVMDTGSTDWTKTIAERFGAEMASFDWCDDFSAARNAALEKVTGDWVLMLDADEELMPDQKDRLRQMMGDPSAIAWRMPLVDKGREGEGVSQVPRLFRNAPGLFYVGRIHEQIFSSVEVRRLEWGLENKFGDVTLLHHGYTQEMVQSRDKVARNLRLLQLAVEELPGEPNLLMNLGLEMVRDGRLGEGLEQYAAAFAALSALPREQVTPELRESLLTQYASHLVSSKRSAEVVRVLQSPLAKRGGLTASMHWLLGLAFIEQKQFAEGAAQMRECLAKRGKPTFAPVNRNILKGGPNHCLALCLSAMKQREPASRAFEAALKEDPGARTVRFDYARFLVEGGHGVDALKWLHELAIEEPGDWRVWQLGGQVALSQPEYLEFAVDWTNEAHKLHSGVPAILEQRATALMLSGEADVALTLWRGLDLKGNAAHRAAMVVCETLAGGPVTPVPGGLAPAVNQEFIHWYRRLLGVNAERLVAVLHQRIDRWRAAVPSAARMIEAAISEAGAVPVRD